MVVDSVLSMILLDESADGLCVAEASIDIESSYSVTPTATNLSSSNRVYKEVSELHGVLLTALDIVSFPMTHKICLKELTNY